MWGKSTHADQAVGVWGSILEAAYRFLIFSGTSNILPCVMLMCVPSLPAVRFSFSLEPRLAVLASHILKVLARCIQYMSRSVEKLEPQPLS